MIVSFDWLRDYVDLSVPPEELAARLTMAGLNLESVEPVGNDVAIDLEVTSNRPDCLGHIGIAREAAVLLGAELKIPPADVATSRRRTAEATSVELQCPDLCPQYIAAVIEGVRIGPSPAWLQDRLRTIGVTPINNVVDATNYVLMECGQPFHAFDFDKLRGRRIVVRRAKKGETIAAIDHRQYQLNPDMCVIADAERAVAVAGVMGGADTEISPGTKTLLLETANFASMSVRRTARTIQTVEGSERRRGLHSPSSYRFERGVDVQRLLWAAKRCAEIILQTAGGEMLSDPVVAGTIPAWKPAPIRLRFVQIERVLGIPVPREEAISILQKLGAQLVGTASTTEATWLPPSWRRDLEREIDLIEEVARIHGYDKIPENRSIPVVAGTRSRAERVTERIRQTVAAAGFDEAITFSFQPESLGGLFDPAPNVAAAVVEPAAGEYGARLRKSIVPSLVACRRENERQGNADARLYEIARVFRGPVPERPETQPLTIGLVSGHSFQEMRGVLDAIVSSTGADAVIETKAANVAGLRAGRAAEVKLNGQPWGYLGELDRDSADATALKLREGVTVAEVLLAPLVELAKLVPEAKPLAVYPAIGRDLNLVLNEPVTWQELEQCVREAAGPMLDEVKFAEQYRGKQVAAGKKSYLFQISYRAPDRTLTGEEVDAAQQRVLAACKARLGVEQR